MLGTDPALREQLEAARDRIRPLQIGKAGQLMEWNGDWDCNAQDPHHRHVSHLFPLHPGHQITVQGTPELALAARASLALRGDDGTGWSLAWKLNFWARLREGNRAFRLIANQLRPTQELRTVMADAGGTYPNLFDAHPPFQIDGNFGFVAGLNELLLQSHERYTNPHTPDLGCYFLDLLPALPSAWSTGSVSGLRVRGGFEVDLQWQDGKLQRATFKNGGGSVARVRYAGKTRAIDLKQGEVLSLDENLNPLTFS